MAASVVSARCGMARLLDRNFYLRAASTVVLLPLLVLCVYWGGAVLAAVLVLASLAMAQEWYKMIQGKIALPRGAVWYALGAAWILIPMGSLYYIRSMGDQAYIAVFFALGIVFVTDTAAFIFGRLIGGPKLAPSISPNKTWSGAVMGVLTSVIAVAAAFHWITPLYSVIDGKIILDWEIIFGLAGMIATLSVLTQIGDLLESKLKRRFGVKDTGNIIPGHGGLLDRTDGWVLTLPVFLLGLTYIAANAAP